MLFFETNNNIINLNKPFPANTEIALTNIYFKSNFFNIKKDGILSFNLTIFKTKKSKIYLPKISIIISNGFYDMSTLVQEIKWKLEGELKTLL